MVSYLVHCLVYITREWYRYFIQYQILVSNLKILVSLKIYYTDTAHPYKIDLTANWTSPHEVSFLLISEIFEVDCAKFNNVKSPGGWKYR